MKLNGTALPNQSWVQSYVTGLSYITATPGIHLAMNSDSIMFSNNGAGLVFINAEDDCDEDLVGGLKGEVEDDFWF